MSKKKPLLLVIMGILLFVAAEITINIYENYDDVLHDYDTDSVETSSTPSTPSTTNDNTSTSTKDSLTVQEEAIYDYIQKQFDIITNNGDYYDPEVHDPIVMNKASKYFGISVDEIDKIYMSASMKKTQGK